MTQEKEVEFYCYTEDTDSKGFDIYINEVKINDNLKYYDKNFQCKWSCLPGKYNIKFVQKHFLNSRLWFLNTVFSMIAMFLAGYYEEINLKGPFYSIQEGELLIKDNAVLEIKLKRSNIFFKLLFDEITNYGFFIEAKSNCSYNCKNEEVVVTSKLRRRFIISVLLPISIAFLFITILLIISGINFFQKGAFVGGTLFGLVITFLFIMYIRVAKNILNVVFGKQR
ncbi:hypothetical protein SAMN00017405_0084 [Desulfonispora thiosulfatigenes DSM 11270]|uniref:Uncharacterized protein n=1 Tax=Desulfonispora thiosulfatigenes DSM 11270 TaxID=656914 RepID=A0A1W1VKY9_DESTI|nr:hypothetical protein [Desulfonispora thiosulfatigenes]SMB93721.1 hypothetical protein SAMN00017405_0084 [Desulfonispora thiosulfatigenes DSM 11270]